MAIYSFGSNLISQLGQGEEFDSTHKPVEVDFFVNKRVKMIEVGSLHTMVVTQELVTAEIDKTEIDAAIKNQSPKEEVVKARKVDEESEKTVKERIFSFGCNDEYALGREGDEATPMETILPKKTKKKNSKYNDHKIKQISATSDATFILTEEGEVFGMGSFKYSNGTAGFDNIVKKQKTPKRIMKGIKKIAAGFNHILMLDLNNNVHFYGINENGEAGVPPKRRMKKIKPFLCKVTSKRTKKFKKVTDIFAGAYSNFIKTEDGIYCFGKNYLNELGVSEEMRGSSEIFKKLDSIEDIGFHANKIIKIKGGDGHTIFMDNSNQLFSVGNNSFGQLGTGNKADNCQKISKINFDLDTIVDFDVNSFFAVFKTSKNKLYGFGCNTDGELGVEEQCSIREPVEIDLSRVKEDIKNVRVGNDFVIVETL